MRWPTVSRREIGSLLKKKDPPTSYMDVSVDQAVIDAFTAIPGVNEDRALTLYFSGFTTMDDLKGASVAKLFGVQGMTLAVAKKIADHFNPNRLVRLETLARDEEAPPKGALSFVGKALARTRRRFDVTDEIEPGEDPELLDLFHRTAHGLHRGRIHDRAESLLPGLSLGNPAYTWRRSPWGW